MTGRDFAIGLLIGNSIKLCLRPPERLTIMSMEDRVTQLEWAFVTLTRLTESMNSRMDTHLSWINSPGEAQANTEIKIAALADTQIRTEETLIKLEAAQIRTDEARAYADARMAALADAQIRTDEALARLADAQAHTDQRLDALIDIVREQRNGKS
jgi:uncharacterized protein YdgA (DUF945 family)